MAFSSILPKRCPGLRSPSCERAKYFCGRRLHPLLTIGQARRAATENQQIRKTCEWFEAQNRATLGASTVPSWTQRRQPTTGSREQSDIVDSPPIRPGFVPFLFQVLTIEAAARAKRVRSVH
jgi:hypothetical protein